MAQMASEKASNKKELTPEQQAIKDEKMARIAERRAKGKGSNMSPKEKDAAVASGKVQVVNNADK